MDAAALTGDQGDYMETSEKNYLETQKKKGHTNFFVNSVPIIFQLWVLSIIVFKQKNL